MPAPLLTRTLLLTAALLLPAATLAAPETAPANTSTSTSTSVKHKPERKKPEHKAETVPVVKSPTAGHPQKPSGKTAAKGTAKTTPAKPAPAAAAAQAPPPAPAAPPAPDAAAQEPPKGSATGLPLPRFASLRSDDVNFRAGPGTRYPIDWVYKRRDLPVEIEREFEVWRLVRDPDGTKGWVHQATLTGRRAFVVTGAEQTMRDGASDTANPVAKLKPGVIGRLRSCAAGADWCEVQVGEYRGWLRRTTFWGAYPAEAVN